MFEGHSGQLTLTLTFINQKILLTKVIGHASMMQKFPLSSKLIPIVVPGELWVDPKKAKGKPLVEQDVAQLCIFNFSSSMVYTGKYVQTPLTAPK